MKTTTPTKPNKPLTDIDKQFILLEGETNPKDAVWKAHSIEGIEIDIVLSS